MKELKKYITDERTGLRYELAGDYYYPCLEAPEATKVGRFGMMYHDYLRNHKRVTYSGLMLSGKLKEQIEEVDRKSQEQSEKAISTANAKDRNLFSNLQPSSIESKRGGGTCPPPKCYGVSTSEPV